MPVFNAALRLAVRRAKMRSRYLNAVVWSDKGKCPDPVVQATELASSPICAELDWSQLDQVMQLVLVGARACLCFKLHWRCAARKRDHDICMWWYDYTVITDKGKCPDPVGQVADLASFDYCSLGSRTNQMFHCAVSPTLACLLIIRCFF